MRIQSYYHCIDHNSRYLNSIAEDISTNDTYVNLFRQMSKQCPYRFLNETRFEYLFSSNIHNQDKMGISVVLRNDLS